MVTLNRLIQIEAWNKMHIHLDLTGGIAGDMFSAALLDARPDLEKPLLDMLKKLQLGTKV